MQLPTTWRGRFILAFLLVQLHLPLRYYLSHRDPHDERFAWRMFSPIRMAQCKPNVTIGDEPAALNREFHEAWIEIAKRGRFVVVEAMGAKLCAKYLGKEVRVTLDCTYLDRGPRVYGGFNMCNVPEL